MSHTHFRTCSLCEAMCGLAIEVEDDRITSIRGDIDDPLSQGHICPKGAALRDLHEDPDRLRYPMRRTRGGRFERISWDAALDEAATRIHEIQETHGRDAVATYAGNPNAHNLGALVFGPMLIHGIGSKRRFSASSVDQWPKMFAAYHMFGHQLLWTVPDVDRTQTFLMLGANPIASGGSFMAGGDIAKRLRALMNRGGRLIVVDPRRTETAAIASEHLFIRPNSDALFLAALLNEVLSRHGLRPRHLAPLIAHAPRLFDAVRRFTPSRVAAQTGIDAATITRIADELAASDAAVVYGRLGTSTQRFGALCQWLIEALNIATGNLDRDGGAMFAEPAFDIVNPPAGVRVGRGSYDRYRSVVRGLPEFGGELPVATLAEEILDAGDRSIRALLTSAGNPVLSTPDGRRLDEALSSLDFMVSIDIYLNETTRHADIILPATSPLERSHYDVGINLLAVRNVAKWSPPLFAPSDETRPEHQIIAGLLRNLARVRGEGILAQEKWRAIGAFGPDRILDVGLRAGPHGHRRDAGARAVTLRLLETEVHGIDLGPLRPCLGRRMPKHHEKIDLAPTVLVDDVARLLETLERPEAPAQAGALRLIGRRHMRSNNSWMHNIPKLVAGKPLCTLMIHPDDAAALGLDDGDAAVVRSRVGEVEVPVEHTRDMMPGVVSLPHGFGHDRRGTGQRVAREHAGVSMNDLTDAQDLDVPSGNAVLTGVPVVVSAAAHR